MSLIAKRTISHLGQPSEGHQQSKHFWQAHQSELHVREHEHQLGTARWIDPVQIKSEITQRKNNYTAKPKRRRMCFTFSAFLGLTE